MSLRPVAALTLAAAFAAAATVLAADDPWTHADAHAEARIVAREVHRAVRESLRDVRREIRAVVSEVTRQVRRSIGSHREPSSRDRRDDQVGRAAARPQARETRERSRDLRSDFPVTLPEGRRRDLRTTLGSGGPLIKVRTVNGGVKLAAR